MAQAKLASAEVLDSPEAQEPLGYREALFVQAYMNNACNGTEAMRKLGYGGKNPDVASVNYLKRPRVQKAVKMALDELRKAEEPTVERVRTEYAKLAFAKYEGQLLAGHKLQALKDLGNHLGMFKPENAVTVPVQINILGGPDLAGFTGDSSGQVSVTLDSPDTKVLDDKPT